MKLIQRCEQLSSLAISFAHRFHEAIIGTQPPQGFVESTRDWATDRAQRFPGTKYVEVAAPHLIRRRPPLTLDGSVHPVFVAAEERLSPELFCVWLPNGRVWSGQGVAVITPDNRVLEDLSLEFGRSRETRTLFHRNALGRIGKRNGTVVSLVTAGADNYYHWLFDLLPRLDILRRSGLDPNRVETFVVNDFHQRFQAESWELLGLQPCQVAAIGEGNGFLQADCVVAPSFPGRTGHPPEWACRFLRDQFLGARRDSEKSSYPRHIYISRAAASRRRIRNAAQVESLLAKFGFETVRLEELPFADQVELFAHAEAIVAPHGAGLSNLVFCTPGTLVIELFTPAYVHFCYWAIANQVALQYFYLVEAPEISPADRETDPDMVVDVARLESLLGRELLVC